MKKLLFVLAFAFIGGQVFSQMYIATLVNSGSLSFSCATTYTLVKVDPLGNTTYDCIEADLENGALSKLTIALNSIINQGYKLVGGANTSNTANLRIHTSGSISQLSIDNFSTPIWYFAIP
jgi:hypothetical protein